MRIYRHSKACLNADRIGTEHLLVALLEGGVTAASRILKELGITRDLVWEALLR